MTEMETAMNINETRQHLLGKQMHLRNLISAEAQEIGHICEGQHKRGKLVSDKWDHPTHQAAQIQTSLSKMQRDLSKLFEVAGADEYLKEQEATK